MKLSLVLLASAVGVATAFAPAKPAGSYADIVAKRQVSAAALRAGSHRRARRAGPSAVLVPQILVSEFITCPPNQDTFSSESATRYPPDSDAGSNTVSCVYKVEDVETDEGITTIYRTCKYDGDSGTPVGENGNTCAANADQAPSTGSCFTACPATAGGNAFVGASVDGSSDALGDTSFTTTCNYSTDTGGSTTLNCMYDTTTGNKVEGTSLACPTLRSTTSCAQVPDQITA